MQQQQGIQLDLFGTVDVPRAIPLTPGRFALAETVATTMARAMAACDVARLDIAGRITALTGRNLTLNVLNNMASRSRLDQVPSLLQAMAFDAVTGQHALLDFYAGTLGGKVIFGRDIVALERGRVVLVEEDLRERKAELKQWARRVKS